jgi:hypothetical protein
MNRPAWIAKVATLWRAEALGPKDLVRRAVFWSVVFLFAHVAGPRDLTAVFSGSRAVPSLPRVLEAILGSAYLVLYLIAVLIVPTLLLAVAISAVATRIVARRGGGGAGDGTLTNGIR